MKKKLTLGVLMVSLAFLAGCGTKEQASQDISKPIIRIEKNVITQKMYDKMFDRETHSGPLAQRITSDNKNPQNKFFSLVIKDKIVNELVIRQLINDEAKRRNITISSAEIDKAVDEITQKLGGKDKLESILTLNNVDRNEFLENVKTDLRTRKLVDQLSAGMVVSDSDVKKFYETNKKAKFTYPDLVRAQHILIKGTGSDAKAKIEKIADELKAKPSDFNTLAAKYSEDTASAARGGDLGFFAQKDMVPEFSKAAFTTPIGQISGIVQTKYGYHIVRIIDRKKAGTTPFIEVKDEIKNYLDSQNKMQVMQKLVEGLKNISEITYVDKEYSPATIQKEIQTLVKDKKLQVPGVTSPAAAK